MIGMENLYQKPIVPDRYFYCLLKLFIRQIYSIPSHFFSCCLMQSALNNMLELISISFPIF